MGEGMGMNPPYPMGFVVAFVFCDHNRSLTHTATWGGLPAAVLASVRRELQGAAHILRSAGHSVPGLAGAGVPRPLCEITWSTASQPTIHHIPQPTCRKLADADGRVEVTNFGPTPPGLTTRGNAWIPCADGAAGPQTSIANFFSGKGRGGPSPTPRVGGRAGASEAVA